MRIESTDPQKAVAPVTCVTGSSLGYWPVSPTGTRNRQASWRPRSDGGGAAEVAPILSAALLYSRGAVRHHAGSSSCRAPPAASHVQRFLIRFAGTAARLRQNWPRHSLKCGATVPAWGAGRTVRNRICRWITGWFLRRRGRPHARFPSQRQRSCSPH